MANSSERKRTPVDYGLLLSRAASLIEEEPFYVPVLSNVSALLYETLPDLNWAGFYLVRNEELVLGPFQGKVACIRIPFGKGVCGTAAKELRTIVVPDVHAFPGHIACDSASNSEIVVPIFSDGTLFGVLDIDSPSFDRFDEMDEAGLNTLAALIGKTMKKE